MSKEHLHRPGERICHIRVREHAAAKEEENQEYCSCGMAHGGEHRWIAQDRAVRARMVRYLVRSESPEVVIEELEDCLLGAVE